MFSCLSLVFWKKSSETDYGSFSPWENYLNFLCSKTISPFIKLTFYSWFWSSKETGKYMLSIAEVIMLSGYVFKEMIFSSTWTKWIPARPRIRSYLGQLSCQPFSAEKRRITICHAFNKLFRCESRLISKIGGVNIEPLVTSSFFDETRLFWKQANTARTDPSIRVSILNIDQILAELFRKNVPQFWVQNWWQNRPSNL